jgi:uncharacterized membrane protein
MDIILIIIIVVAAIAATVTFIFSNQGDPKERAKEAGEAAIVGAFYSGGCILQTIMSAIPIIIGLFFLGLILKSCH